MAKSKKKRKKAQYVVPIGFGRAPRIGNSVMLTAKDKAKSRKRKKNQAPEGW